MTENISFFSFNKVLGCKKKPIIIIISYETQLPLTGIISSSQDKENSSEKKKATKSLEEELPEWRAAVVIIVPTFAASKQACLPSCASVGLCLLQKFILFLNDLVDLRILRDFLGGKCWHSVLQSSEILTKKKKTGFFFPLAFNCVTKIESVT